MDEEEWCEMEDRLKDEKAEDMEIVIDRFIKQTKTLPAEFSKLIEDNIEDLTC